MEFIQGEKFIKLDNNKNIFYRHVQDVDNFFKNLPTSEPFILISHNSDGCVGTVDRQENDTAHVNLMPNNLVKWYSQNVNYKHKKIESIPIGLENNQWFQQIRKREKMIMKLNENRFIKNLLYLNHNIKTNFDRKEPYDLLSNRIWVTAIHGVNGQNFDQYIDSIYNHKFILCPEGHGIDTHRTWEGLYLGTIPIEKRNINNSFYEDLPICFVDEWSEISEDFLNKEYNRIKNKEWNLEKIDFIYWKNRIIYEGLHCTL